MKVIGLVKDTESVMVPHTTKMLDWGKRFNAHLRRGQLKPENVVLASISLRKLQALHPRFGVVARAWKLMEQGSVK